MTFHPDDPHPFSEPGTPPEDAPLRSSSAGRATRPPWILLGSLAALCLVLVGIDTLVIPMTLPALAWGPVRSAGLSGRFPSRDSLIQRQQADRSQRLDPSAVIAIRREILQAIEAQEGPGASE